MNTKKIKPLGNKVLIEKQEPITMKGSILLPDCAKEKPRQGIIRAIGEGKIDKKGNLIPIEVSIGDTVLFSSYAGTEIKEDNKDFLILSADDILALLQ